MLWRCPRECAGASCCPSISNALYSLFYASCVQVLGAPLPVAVSVPVAVDDGVMAAEAEAEAAELQLLETQARCEFTSPCKRYAHTTPCQFRHATHMHMPCTCTCQYRAHAHAHEHARRRSPRRSRLRQRHALQGRRRPPPRRSLGEEEGEAGNLRWQSQEARPKTREATSSAMVMRRS